MDRRRLRKQRAIERLTTELEYKGHINRIAESLERLAENNQIDIGGPIDEVQFVDSSGEIIAKFDRGGAHAVERMD